MRIDEIHPAGWHPAPADRIHFGFDAASGPPGSLSPGSLSAGLVARWLLLGAVIAGVFLLHVLTAENNHSTHGVFLSPTITDASQSATPQSTLTSASGGDASDAVVQAVSGVVTPSGDRDAGEVSGCVLLLVVTAAAAVLLLMQAGQVYRWPPRPTGDAGAITVRGLPPSAMPRLSLGVMRV